ncbi:MULTISPECIES: hypothetical protein, partial [unclassified Myroides]|uniref:hypothetical protein n=1 Tax=unclassified Myroides TaxID=2642485 RepID=UPI003D2F6413
VEIKQEQKKEKVHWQDLPQYFDPQDSLFREVMKGREKKYQEAMRNITVAGTNGMPDYGYKESEYKLEDLNLLNELYYEGLKSRGFQFPDEATFAKGIQDIFGVDIYADHSNNPRVTTIGDYLILTPKLHTKDLYTNVPLLRLTHPNFVFDRKKRYYINGINGIWEEYDDFGEIYYIYPIGNSDLSSNEYIFYRRKAALNIIYHSYFSTKLVEYAGYEGFALADYDIYKNIQRKYMKKYNEMSERTRKGWDYRMFDRLFFSRGFDGKLIVKKKMLAAAIELAQEDEAYIRVPLDYYFVQMTTDYVPNEYAADESEVDNYMKQREPYYTPEERAMIWVYTALLELNLPPSETMPTPYMFIALAIQYPALYKVAEEHLFFGEDMSLAFEYMSKSQFQF